MDDLRINREKKEIKKRKIKYLIISFLKKYRWWILSILILSTIIIFPEQSGNAIGEWIVKFIGTILENIKTI